MPLRHLPALAAALLLLVLTACGGDSADPEAFCESNARLEELGDFLAAPPDEAEPLVAEVREIFSEGEATAPDEISAQYAVIVDAFTALLDVFEESGFGADEVDPVALEAALEGLNSAETLAANDEVQEWLEINCPTQ